MLLIRIKLKNRGEIHKYLFSSKKSFSYGGLKYHIDPHCVYNTKLLGFLSVRCIDYIQGNTDPVNYYNLLDRANLRKQKDTINSLVKGWFTNKILKLIDYLLIGLAVSSGSAIVSAVLVFLLGQHLGAW